MEQSELNEEHGSVRYIICPSLFEQLGFMQQYHMLRRAESKTDICLVKYEWEQCLSLERIPRDLLIFEEINNICRFQVRFESMTIPRYLT